jgi:pimeloyl-ACP methyl ester carboxylesterase
VLLVSSTGSSAASSLSFIPCPEASAAGFQCAALQVPLEHSEAVPGTVTLNIERKLAGATPSRDAVVALAGGPGQAALPLAAFIAKAIAPALGSRDLLVFDQRGTGTSDPLSCSALEASSDAPLSSLIERCAAEIGPARGAYTTQESVEDIEALRVAGGYEKLVLYGTSYGTKVALEYAERYPQNVQALVLDSVVPSDVPDPLDITSFQAIPGILDELCAGDACAGITNDPVADLARLTARLQKRALSGSVYDGAGRRHAITMTAPDLFHILEAGDLNPALRALLPAAMVSALRGDHDPLLRLQALSEGLVPSVPVESSGEATPEIDFVLYLDTLCEESPFPWSRGAPAATRLQEASAFTNALPASDFYPFEASASFANSLVPECAYWPDASPPPPAPSPLPDVPTLILSGEQDMRTPTSNARAVAAEVPDAQLLLVPFTGHSVLGSDLSDCSALAVQDFFAAVPVEPCANTPNQFSPTPITPRRLAAIRPPHGLSGRPGKTAVAVLDTLVDLNQQVIAATLQADVEQLPSGSSFGGLRGGYAKLTRKTATLKDFSLVPGVQLSATFPIRDGHLQSASITVSGTQAANGTVRFGSSSTHIVGTLGSRHIDLDVAKVTFARAGTREWPSIAVLDQRLERLRLAAGAGGQPASRLP